MYLFEIGFTIGSTQHCKKWESSILVVSPKKLTEDEILHTIICKFEDTTKIYNYYGIDIISPDKPTIVNWNNQVCP